MIDRRQGDDNLYKTQGLTVLPTDVPFHVAVIQELNKNNACTALALIPEQKQNRLN